MSHGEEFHWNSSTLLISINTQVSSIGIFYIFSPTYSPIFIVTILLNIEYIVFQLVNQSTQLL